MSTARNHRIRSHKSFRKSMYTRDAFRRKASANGNVVKERHKFAGLFGSLFKK